MSAVEKAIAGIARQNPLLAAQLKRLADNLECSDILNVLKPAGDSGGGGKDA